MNIVTDNTPPPVNEYSEGKIRSYAKLQPLAARFRDYAAAGNVKEARIAMKDIYATLILSRTAC